MSHRSSMEFAPGMRGDGSGHGMQHMKPIGTPGRPNHQGHGSSTMLADSGYGPTGNNASFYYYISQKSTRPSPCLDFFFAEKSGILKKPGPYGSMEVSSMEKEKWLEENADRLSRMERLDRLSMSSQNQLNVQQVQQQQSAQDAMKSVNGYHESLIEALRNAAAAANSSQRGSNSSNSFGLGVGGPSTHRSSAASLTEDLRKTLADSYFEYGASLGLVPGPSGPMGAAPSTAAVVAAAAAAAAAAKQHQMKVSSREKLDGPDGSSGSAAAPIRIRNLEDLIRQLEHSSRHAMSPNGSDEMPAHDPRHYR